jgi:hypothetical protein
MRARSRDKTLGNMVVLPNEAFKEKRVIQPMHETIESLHQASGTIQVSPHGLDAKITYSRLEEDASKRIWFHENLGDCRKMAYQVAPDFRASKRRDNRRIVDEMVSSPF